VLNRKSPRVDAKRAALKALRRASLSDRSPPTAATADSIRRPASPHYGKISAARNRVTSVTLMPRTIVAVVRTIGGGCEELLGRDDNDLGTNEHCQCFVVNARRDACPDQTERLVQMASAASDFRSFHFSRVPVREGDFPTEVMRPFRQLGFARRIVSLSPTHYFICNAIEHF